MINILIPAFCRKIMNALENNGFECFLVGGCVRDSLMGIVPNDYDIATNATPFEMKSCFDDFKVIETGLAHGTLTVATENGSAEITTYRIDGEYNDNRHPENIEFTGNLHDDLKRRDFTVNSLAYNESQGLIDIFCGEEDIKNKTIRCVGAPDKRFSEDGLRILRALRFSSVLGFTIDENTAKSIHANKNLLKNISAERIFVEFKKLLCGENAENVLLEFRDVIAVFIPEIEPCFDFNQNTKYHCYDVYTHIVKSVSAVEADEKLRLTCFFHDIGKPPVYFTDEKGVGHFYGHCKVSAKMTENILKRLKTDNDTIDFVCSAVLLHDREIAETEKSVKRFLVKYSPDFLRNLIKIKRADAKAHAPKYSNRDVYLENLLRILEKIEDEKQCFLLKNLALNGNDLIENGFEEGKNIGKVLNELLLAVIDGKVKNDKNSLLNYIKKSN